MNCILEALLKLLLAVLLGGIVGYEREYQSRPAGLRTHILVCVGAALVQITSINYFRFNKPVGEVDPMRLGAQVISGVGFLGAGTILKEKGSIKGLTTAASLWVVACIGLAVGSGLYIEAIFTTIIIYISLVSFKRIERNVAKGSGYYTLKITVINEPKMLGRITKIIGDLNINIEGVETENINDNLTTFDLTLILPSKVNINALLDNLNIEGIKGININKL